MPNHDQYGNTLFLSELKPSATVTKLKRVHFTKNASEGSIYDEAWLQGLIMSHPNLLPIDQIEPAFANLVPICTELQSTSGFLDNLLLTPNGNIALIECKLFRNPEARRQVIAQIIDYANALSTWTYPKLEESVRNSAHIGAEAKSKSLYELVSLGNEIDEPTFIDAISRNLRKGRFLLLVVGDGIREEVESMTEFLQQHAGLHFILSLVEIALFEASNGGYIAQPRVLAKTINIERGIVEFVGSTITIKPPTGATGGAGGRTTITKELYLEQLEKLFPGISQRINTFVDKLAELNVIPEIGTNSMILRWHPDSTITWNLATISSIGLVWTDFLSNQAASRGLLELSRKYRRDLAELIPGAFVKETPKEAGWYISFNGKTVTIDLLLADEQRANGWLQAISEFQLAVSKSLQSE
jgi:hypothetical protein